MKQKFEESLPDYEEYKNMSCIMIAPKENSRKTPLKKSQKSKKEFFYSEPEKMQKGTVLNNTFFEPNIIKNLRAIYKQYSEKFDFTCTKILEQKYKPINKSIYKYSSISLTNSNGILGCLMLNTEQNSPEFFQQLSDYIKRKSKKNKDKFDLEKIIEQIYPKNFTNLEQLFDQLEIGDSEVLERKDGQLTRLLVVNDIQAINSVAFNIFIARLLEYNRIPFPKYNYILIFDIAYDPKNLYDKFNVSFLPKLQFLTINNTPSHHLYHQILYDFIYSSNSGFYIPKSQSIKVILDSIELHQISIDAFKHYFKFILFQFFFMHQWNDDEYLLYMDELNEDIIEKEIKEEKANKEEPKDKKSQKKKSLEIDNSDTIVDNKRREILEQKLIEIYSSTNELKELTKKYKLLPTNITIEVEKLLNNFKEKMNNWKIFKYFYELFEGLIKKYLTKEKNFEEKIYNFLYKFLQYDSEIELDKIIRNRVDEIHVIISKIEKPNEAIKDYIFPKFKKIAEKIEPLLNEEDKDLILKSVDYLDNYVKTFDNMDVKKMILIPDTIKIWVKELFKLNCFIKINKAENEAFKENSTRKFMNVYRTYSNFKEMIEPPLMQRYLIDLYDYATESEKNKFSFDIKEKDFDFKNILKAYFKCLMNLDSSFKLNHFFYDFLIEFKISEVNEKNKDLVEKYKKVFLILSYWFNLVGVFQRKKGKNKGFIKNYYNISNFFEDPKYKNIGNPNHK